ncbi:uncharacterized protein ACB058_010187 isoform 1-T2 [Synchiropus picturatus]
MKTRNLFCLLPLVCFLILSLQTSACVAQSDQTPITIRVTDSVTNTPNKTYSTSVKFRGNVLGGMRRLRETSSDFTFTYSENADYGPFLESVNGLAGSAGNQTYWELLVSTECDLIRPDVGIGCYIPDANDMIILKYRTWGDHSKK